MFLWGHLYQASFTQGQFEMPVYKQEDTLQWTSILSRGGGNQHKLLLFGPLAYVHLYLNMYLPIY